MPIIRDGMSGSSSSGRGTFSGRGLSTSVLEYSASVGQMGEGSSDTEDSMFFLQESLQGGEREWSLCPDWEGRRRLQPGGGIGGLTWGREPLASDVCDALSPDGTRGKFDVLDAAPDPESTVFSRVLTVSCTCSFSWPTVARLGVLSPNGLCSSAARRVRAGQTDRLWPSLPQEKQTLLALVVNEAPVASNT